MLSLNPQNPYSRWQVAEVQRMLSQRRVLVIAGPRQCGKTTMAREVAFKLGFSYQTLDDPTSLRAAINDPKGFIRHGDDLMIIDEVQRAPLLLQTIKLDVDENQKPGRYLLTGSANIQSLPGVTESLAGRVSNLRLRPLAMGEIYGGSPHFLANAFEGKFMINKPFSIGESAFGGIDGFKQWSKDRYLTEAFNGGFPEARQLQTEVKQRHWHKDFINALIERDLKDITKIRRKDSMVKLVEVMAAWSSKFMDIAAICSQLHLNRETIESYINALETLFLIEKLRPWYKGDYDRMGKREKIFMVDSGLMAALLRWQFDKVRFDSDLNGKLIETFVFNQLMVHIDMGDGQYSLSHYRDGEQREVDFIVERDDGAILAIEVKAGSLVDASSFKHINWFDDRIVPQQNLIGIVLYTGDHLLSFGQNRWAVPINALWA
ncbi:MAG: ATP-binding protein [Candidatus Pacebacteria bacterium]|nr:ATP-binding protein [Candidatus Paceibacterota bacterium]